LRRLLLAGVLALGLGGCGATRPKPLSSLQLREQAGAICSAASAAANAIPAPGWNDTPRFLARGLEVLRPELVRLRSLHPMGAAGSTYRLALSSFDAELGAIARARVRLAHGADPVLTIQRLQHELAPAEAIARRAWDVLGVPSCLA
jgi:hypothetical protein